MTKSLLVILGVVLTGIGILGFFNNPIFGIFLVDTPHNIVHLVTGLLALVFTYEVEYAQVYSRIMAAVYGILFLAGLVSTDNTVMGMAVDSADNVLHLFFALGFLYAGFATETHKMVMKAHH